MEEPKELRTVEVMVAGVGWSPVPFEQLVEEDTFRMFEADGQIYMDEAGNTEFVAEGDAFCVDGTWTVKVK
jgi:hypothetical protein